MITYKLIDPKQPEYDAILSWPFGDGEFFERQIPRLLRTDIPARHWLGACHIWAYSTATDGLVGFGALDLCRDHELFAADRMHCYIPLLAVHPDKKGRGFGKAVVNHLIEAAKSIRKHRTDLADDLLLDVYTNNNAAVGLYLKCGFKTLNPTMPVPDPAEGDEPFFVMAYPLEAAGDASSCRLPS